MTRWSATNTSTALHPQGEQERPKKDSLKLQPNATQGKTQMTAPANEWIYDRVCDSTGTQILL